MNIKRKFSQEKPILITGGAGFIGTNLAHHFAQLGRKVILYDNLSRPGSEKNLEWLIRMHPSLIKFEKGDIRNFSTVRQIARKAQQVFHFAAQVAVTTSILAPREDFEINALGTLNLLEALRSLSNPPPLLFTSTNKVLGPLAHVPLQEQNTHYEAEHEETRKFGIGESSSLNFYSPYGCSKGSADQYVLDYSRVYSLPSVVFRMSCIYGPHQFGNEDQGWIAHFLIQALNGNPILIYGDGKQVRDALHINDLIEAFTMAQRRMEEIAGRAFHIGGGPNNCLSLLQLINLIEEIHGSRPQMIFKPWRCADQRYYVSDIRNFQVMTGWSPTIDIREGVRRLYDWLRETKELCDFESTTEKYDYAISPY